MLSGTLNKVCFCRVFIPVPHCAVTSSVVSVIMANCAPPVSRAKHVFKMASHLQACGTQGVRDLDQSIA